MLATTRFEDVPFSWESITMTRPNPNYEVLSCNKPRASFRRMFEAYTPNSYGSKTVWKSFEHYKRASNDDSLQFSACPCGADLRDFNDLHIGTITDPWAFFPTGRYGEIGKADIGLPTFYSPRADGGFVPPPPYLDDLVTMSLRAMLPVIKSELSLVNSIIELKDFATLKGTLTHVKDVILKWNLLPGRLGNRTLRQLLRAGSDGYLQTKFNILPLLSDIAGILTALHKTRARLNAYVSQSGRVRVSHFSRDLNEYVSVLDPEYSDSLARDCYYNGSAYQWAGTQKNQRHVLYDTTKFHAQLQYNYNYTAYQIEHARLLSLLDALGVNLNPAIIWNAIPWSFVIDWVFGVSRWLSEQRIGNMDPKINMLQYLWSVRRRRQILVYSKVSSYPKWGNPTIRPFTSVLSRPVVQETAYRRTVGLPAASSFTTSGLSPTEFSLGAALVLSRGRH